MALTLLRKRAAEMASASSVSPGVVGAILTFMSGDPRFLGLLPSSKFACARILGPAVFLVAVLMARPSASQPQVFLPPNVLLPNGDSLPVGAIGGLEGNSFIARTNDSTAPWFNPAGLARATSSSASVSAGTLRFVSVNPEGAESTGESVNVLPAAVGFVVKRAFGHDDWTFGFLVARNAAWNQQTDFQYVSGSGLLDRTTSAGDAEFNRTTIALTVGWKGAGQWRFGGGLLTDILHLNSVQSATFRRQTATYMETLIGTNRASGSQGTFRLGLGAQADLSERLKFGVTLRTPGLQIFPSGAFSGDVIAQRGPVSTQVSFFDAETVDFKYKLPFEGGVGLAWVSEKFEIEANVKGLTSVSAYDGFASPEKVIYIVDPGNGSPATVRTEPFPGRVFEGRGVVNFCLGGRMNLDSRNVWKLHAGYTLDQSPVGDDDQFFDRIDLNTVTIGVSGAAFHISGSLGLTYQFGTSGERPVTNLSEDKVTMTKFKVSNWGVLYSFSYVF